MMFILKSGLRRYGSSVEISHTPPVNPVRGQLWLDSSSQPPVLKVYDGSRWNVVTTSERSSSSEGIGDMIGDFRISQVPAPGAIPIADESGKLDRGWLPDLGISISDAIYVSEDGKVGIGTTEPSSKFTVKSDDVALSPIHVDVLVESQRVISASGWFYRRPIVVFNGSTSDLLDYQVLLSLDTLSLISQGKMRSDCRDIRFFDSDGTLLSYWIESGINTTGTRIWVKVPFVPAGSSKTIYVYYGNLNATSLSSVGGVFLREIGGLIGAWSFDEGSGTVSYDNSGYGRNAVLKGGTSWATGKFGKAVYCDGSSGYVEIGGNISPTNQITLAVWAYVTGDNGNSNQDLIRKSLGGGKGYHIRWRHGDNYVRFFLNINNTWYYVTDTVSNTSYLNGWHHFVGTYDGSQMKFYVDNVLKGVVNISGSITYDSSTVTWLMTEGGGYLRGYVDSFFVFSRGLTSEEISALYNNYGYATVSYSGKVLVRKYVSPEPIIVVGDEELAGDIVTEYRSQPALYVQGGTGNVGIGTVEPSAKLHVFGEVRVEGSLDVETHIVDSDVFLDSKHCMVLANASRGPLTITLPKASESRGRLYFVKKIDNTSNAVIMTPRVGERVDGQTSISLTTLNGVVRLVSDGLNWYIV